MEQQAENFLELTPDTLGPAAAVVLACAFLSAAVWAWFNEKEWGLPKDRLVVAFGLLYPAFVVVAGLVCGQGFVPFVVWLLGLVAVVIGSLLYLLVLTVRDALRRE